MSDPTQEQSLESQIAILQGGVTNLVNILFRGIEERLLPYDLAVVDYAVLTACFANEPVTVSGLTQHVPVDAGRISRMVSKLEDRGLVRKVRLRTDRRVVRVEMTEEGRAMATELMESVGEHYTNIIRNVSAEELTGLMAFVEKMTENATGALEQAAGESGRR